MRLDRATDMSQPRRQQHAATEPSSPRPDSVPVPFSRTAPKDNGKKETNALVLNHGGNSNDAPTSVPGEYKLRLNGSRKPSPEAKRLQLLLHEKFVAQRRKDAIALQLPNENPKETKTLPTKKLRKKEKKILSRKKLREARRATKEAPAEPSDLETTFGRRNPLSRSTLLNVPPALSFTSPDTEKVPGKPTRKTTEKAAPRVSSNGPAKAQVNSKTAHDRLSAAVQSAASKLDEEMKRPGSGVSLLQESHSPEASKPKTKKKKKKSAKPTEVGKIRESGPTRTKVESGDNLHVRRLPSKGALMEPRNQRRSVLGMEASSTSEQAHKEVPNSTAAEEKFIKSRARSRSAGSRSEAATPIENIDASSLEISALDLEQPPVPHLSYGLERVLFNPGVYHLQDPRSRVYNFDPYLQTIMPVADFNFDALKEYVTSSRDTALQELAASYDKRYVGSSSSMTGILAHFHFLLSQWRSINTSMLSREFPERHVSKFTELQRSPSAIFLKWRNGSYAIDADKEFAGANVLMLLGKSMEKLLTLKTQDFEKYRKSSLGEVSKEDQNAPESYHYSTMGDFIMRSQLDAHDPRLPGTGMFDLKTRAVVSVRMDASNFEEGAGYQIKSRQGAWESFEREYFDMIRSAFLKYSLQVRMGRMDGIFVAYHNTDRIFGFQYVSLSEMDSTLHGQWDTCLGDQEFKLSIKLLNDVLNKATKKYPETSLRLHFETREAQTPFMYIFAEPVTEEQITEIQTANDAKIQEFEQQVCGIMGDTATSEEDQGWKNLQANVQDAMDEDLRDPNHDEGRQELDPVLTSTKRDSMQEQVPSGNSESIDPSNGSVIIAAENDEDLDADSDEDEEADEDDEDEDDEEEDDDDDDYEDDEDGVVPEGMLVDNAGDRGGPISSDIGTNVRGRQLQDGDSGGTPSSTGTEKQCGRDVGAVRETQDSAESQDIAKAGNLETCLSTSSGDGSSVISSSKAEESDAEGGEESPNSQVGDEFPTEADVPFIERISENSDATGRPEGKEVMALTLTIRNKVNDSYVLRPENLGPKDQWTMEYSLDEVSKPDRAWSLYQACRIRRKKKLDDVNRRSENDDEVDYYIRRLREMSRKGAEWRKKQDEKDKGSPVKVLGEPIHQNRNN
ncbi:MAG: hypothetical protein Q9215_002489 [Flavoplaca cf. flavocitrina]